MIDFAPIFERHKLAALSFSGGKDSLACLWLLRDYWDKIDVVWCNTGDAFPETRRLMHKVRQIVPRFVEVMTDVKYQNELWGWPVDLLPVRNHANVQAIMFPHQRQRLQSCIACCNENLWEPTMRSIEKSGATMIIRGQKLVDVQRSPVRSGDLRMGFEFLMPVEDWTDREVIDYVKRTPLGLPEHYEHMHTSLDCQHCTAHLFENIDKRRYMRQFHPAAYREVSNRLRLINQECEKEHEHLMRAIRT